MLFVPHRVRHPYLCHYHRDIPEKAALFADRECRTPGKDDIRIQRTGTIPIARLRRYAGTPACPPNPGKRTNRGTVRAIYQRRFFFFGQEAICGRGLASRFSRTSRSRCGGLPKSSRIRGWKSRSARADGLPVCSYKVHGTSGWLAPLGCGKSIPQGLKAMWFAWFMYGLKPVHTSPHLPATTLDIQPKLLDAFPAMLLQIRQQSLVRQVKRVGVLPVMMNNVMQTINDVFVADLDC
jgi:hypothetical protein